MAIDRLLLGIRGCSSFVVLALVILSLTGCISLDGEPKSLGSASLSWVAPLSRVDKTPISMSDIGGYRIYRGADPHSLELVIDISDPYQMEYAVLNLSPGTHFFAVTAYTKDGNESDFSSIVSKTI